VRAAIAAGPIPLKTRFVRRLNSVPVIHRGSALQAKRRSSCAGRVSGDARPAGHRVSRFVRSKFVRIRHIRKVERLAPFRQRDPRIPQACIMFPLLGVVCFLRQRCALGGRFPCGLTFGSHLVVSNVGRSDGTPEVVCMRHPAARIPVRRVVVTRFDSLDDLPSLTVRRQAGAEDFRISSSVVSVVLCWLRSRQHPWSSSASGRSNTALLLARPICRFRRSVPPGSLAFADSVTDCGYSRAFTYAPSVPGVSYAGHAAL
jgi:hypothetical protein